MHIVFGIISVGLLGLIVFFALSPKSSRILRLSALTALGLIGLALGICGILLIRGPAEEGVEIPLPIFADSPPPPVKDNNRTAIVIFFVVLVLILGMIIAISLRSQKKQGAAVEKAEKPRVLPVERPNTREQDTKKSGIKEFDESFDIDAN